MLVFFHRYHKIFISIVHLHPPPPPPPQFRRQLKENKSCIGCVYSRVVSLAAAATRLVHTVTALTMLAALHCTRSQPRAALPVLLMNFLQHLVKIIPY